VSYVLLVVQKARADGVGRSISFLVLILEISERRWAETVSVSQFLADWWSCS
jgi:hypothetical protein